MASAGRILIIPKGTWNAEVEYEMLDLVFHNHISWLSKKVSKGVEPNEVNTDYWFKLCESADLSEINQRLSALESQMLSTISLDDIDLSDYALKTELNSTNSTVNGIKTDVSTMKTNVSSLTTKANTLESNVEDLSETVSNLQTSMEGMGNAGTNFSNRNVLDYSQMTTMIYTELPYTCPSAGEVLVYVEPTGGETAVLKIKKNSISAAYISGTSPVATTFPVASGDVLSNEGAGSVLTGKVTFIPYKYQ